MSSKPIGFAIGLLVGYLGGRVLMAHPDWWPAFVLLPLLPP